MKFTKLFLALGALAAWSFSAHAAISVTASGTPSIPFTTATVPIGDWASKTIGANLAGTFTGAAALDLVVKTNVASNIITPLPTDAVVSPAPGGNALFRLNTAGTYLQSRATGNEYQILKATLRNDAANAITEFTVSYDFGVLFNPASLGIVEEIPGFLAYYSTTGAAGSWVAIPSFTTGAAGALSATITLTATDWLPGANLFLLWADDNATATSGTGAGVNVEGAYTIDNFAVSAVTLDTTPIPLAVVLNTPTNGAIFITTDTINGSATTTGTTLGDAVGFHINGGALIIDDLTAPSPFTAAVPPPNPAGTYTIQAFATNLVDPVASSAIHTIKVREAYAFLTPSGTYSENFDSMGSAGTSTETPLGWYVGTPASPSGLLAVVGDGSVAPAAATAQDGWNYGVGAGADRSLGTSATGGDRNTVLRLRNDTGSNILSFSFKYDGELWRTHATAGQDETNVTHVSFDLGATWVAVPAATFFTDQLLPADLIPAATAKDGHAAQNRIANLSSGTITPPAKIASGGLVYVRWQNINEAAADGAMAIDNFSFTVESSEEAVLFLAVSSPTDGQMIAAAGCTTLADITVNAQAGAASGNTITSVDFQLDGGTAINDTTSPYSATFTGAGIGAHTITVTANQSGGATVVSNLSVSVVGNQAPVVTFGQLISAATPHSLSSTGTTFLAGSSIRVNHTVADNNIASVEFFVNDRLLNSNAAPFAMTVDDAYAGTSIYWVRATDACGLVSSNTISVTATNPPFTMIVTNGSLWQYFNTNSAPPTDNEGDPWNSVNYDDTIASVPLWRSGYGELGGGDGPGRPERTIIDIGPANPRYNTIYFRHVFNVASLAGLDELIVASMHDDGAVVYLNGNPLAVFNMPAGPYTYATFAMGLPGGADGEIYYRTNAASTLVVGANTLAVEVHQNAVGSTDLSFDLMLMAVPKVFITLDSGTDTVTLSWTATGHTLQQSDSIEPTSWVDVTSTSPHVVSPASSAASPKFYRLRP